MRRPLLIIGLVSAIAIAPALAADGLADLQTALRELEQTVRALHAARQEATTETERGRAAAARLDAEARDLEREAQALEDEAAPVRDAVRRLETERRALDERKARALDDRRAALAAIGSATTFEPALLEAVAKLDARIDAASSVTETEGALKLGAFGRAEGDAARRLRDALEGRRDPAPVSVPLDLGGR